MTHNNSGPFGPVDPCSPVSGYIQSGLPTQPLPKGCFPALVCGVLAILTPWHPAEDFSEHYPLKTVPDRTTICTSGGQWDAFQGYRPCAG